MVLQVVLKLGATCPTSGICNGDTRYMFTNFRKKIAMKAQFTEKKIIYELTHLV